MTVAAAFAVVAPTGTAQAVEIELATFTGTHQNTYSPGVKTAPDTVTISGTVNLLCEVVAPGVPLVLKGKVTGGGTGTLSCASLLSNASGTSTVVWTRLSGASYDSSDYSWSSSTAPGAAGTTVRTLTGTITSGLFQGAKLVLPATFINADLTACDSPQGLTSRSGTATAVITSLL
jgi:hypothetical protein